MFLYFYISYLGDFKIRSSYLPIKKLKKICWSWKNTEKEKLIEDQLEVRDNMIYYGEGRDLGLIASIFLSNCCKLSSVVLSKMKANLSWISNWNWMIS